MNSRLLCLLILFNHLKIFFSAGKKYYYSGKFNHFTKYNNITTLIFNIMENRHNNLEFITRGR